MSGIDAGTRILRAKFTMGLFENPYSDASMAEQLGKKEHRDLAREAVRKSLLLLKNGGKMSDKPLTSRCCRCSRRRPRSSSPGATPTAWATSAAAGRSSGRATLAAPPLAPPSSTQ